MRNYGKVLDMKRPYHQAWFFGRLSQKWICNYWGTNPIAALSARYEAREKGYATALTVSPTRLFNHEVKFSRETKTVPS